MNLFAKHIDYAGSPLKGGYLFCSLDAIDATHFRLARGCYLNATDKTNMERKSV